MRIPDFAVEVCRHEGKKKQVDIAQVREVLKVANMLLRGRLYTLIRYKQGDWIIDDKKV